MTGVQTCALPISIIFYLQETVLFLEAFLSGGLFIGFTLPDGFLSDEIGRASCRERV